MAWQLMVLSHKQAQRWLQKYVGFLPNTLAMKDFAYGFTYEKTYFKMAVIIMQKVMVLHEC